MKRRQIKTILYTLLSLAIVYAIAVPSAQAVDQTSYYLHDPLGSGWVCLHRTDMDGISMRAGFYPDSTPVSLVDERFELSQEKVCVKIGSIIGWVRSDELSTYPMDGTDTSRRIDIPCFDLLWTWVLPMETTQRVRGYDKSECLLPPERWQSRRCQLYRRDQTQMRYRLLPSHFCQRHQCFLRSRLRY